MLGLQRPCAIAATPFLLNTRLSARKASWKILPFSKRKRHDFAYS
jgi:hypothetical protein